MGVAYNVDLIDHKPRPIFSRRQFARSVKSSPYEHNGNGTNNRRCDARNCHDPLRDRIEPNACVATVRFGAFLTLALPLFDRTGCWSGRRGVKVRRLYVDPGLILICLSVVILLTTGFGVLWRVRRERCSLLGSLLALTRPHSSGQQNNARNQASSNRKTVQPITNRHWTKNAAENPPRLILFAGLRSVS